MEIEQLPQADFRKQLRTRVDASREKQPMLFVCGYCATFHDAAGRTAQIAYDLPDQGLTMFFSWPAVIDSEKFNARPNYLRPEMTKRQRSSKVTLLIGLPHHFVRRIETPQPLSGIGFSIDADEAIGMSITSEQLGSHPPDLADPATSRRVPAFGRKGQRDLSSGCHSSRATIDE